MTDIMVRWEIINAIKESDQEAKDRRQKTVNLLLAHLSSLFLELDRMNRWISLKQAWP
jgi:hypothetical protein